MCTGRGTDGAVTPSRPGEVHRPLSDDGQIGLHTGAKSLVGDHLVGVQSVAGCGAYLETMDDRLALLQQEIDRHIGRCRMGVLEQNPGVEARTGVPFGQVPDLGQLGHAHCGVPAATAKVHGPLSNDGLIGLDGGGHGHVRHNLIHPNGKTGSGGQGELAADLRSIFPNEGDRGVCRCRIGILEQNPGVKAGASVALSKVPCLGWL